MEAEKTGIKEIKEVLEGAMLLVSTYKSAMKDGKIDLADLPVLVTLATESKKLVDAVDGFQKCGEELKDLDAEEAVQLVKDLYALVQSVKA